MPNLTEPGNISPEQYQEYADAWIKLVDSGNQDALTQAFQLPEVARLNFLTFSIDQVVALVSAADAHTIKARFLLIPDEATGRSRFSATLFATDADNKTVTDYYLPTQAPTPPATTGQVATTNESTKLPREEAVRWLTDWVDARALLPAFFASSHGPMHGYNYELSTFTDPLAAAAPYDGKVLFLNLGLEPLLDGQAATQLCNLVVYINLSASRTQGSVAGLPADESFYDKGDVCPPALFL